MGDKPKLKFSLEIRFGLQTVAFVIGNEVSPNKADMSHVIEYEQALERLFGLRFHINQVQ